MRSYNNLYEPMLQDDYIKQCFINASKKKKNRNDVREVLENLDEHTELLKKMLTEELFIPDYHKPSIINESSSKKTRRILKPHYKYEQVIFICGRHSPQRQRSRCDKSDNRFKSVRNISTEQKHQ